MEEDGAAQTRETTFNNRIERSDNSRKPPILWYQGSEA